MLPTKPSQSRFEADRRIQRDANAHAYATVFIPGLQLGCSASPTDSRILGGLLTLRQPFFKFDLDLTIHSVFTAENARGRVVIGWSSRLLQVPQPVPIRRKFCGAANEGVQQWGALLDRGAFFSGLDGQVLSNNWWD